MLKNGKEELLKSLQWIGSTHAGESSLAGSERQSLGFSKLKDSKMSATTFNCLLDST